MSHVLIGPEYQAGLEADKIPAGMRCALYDDIGGQPSYLLTTFTDPPNWQVMGEVCAGYASIPALSPVYVEAGKRYWIGVHFLFRSIMQPWYLYTDWYMLDCRRSGYVRSLSWALATYCERPSQSCLIEAIRSREVNLQTEDVEEAYQALMSLSWPSFPALTGVPLISVPEFAKRLSVLGDVFVHTQDTSEYFNETPSIQTAVHKLIASGYRPYQYVKVTEFEPPTNDEQCVGLLPLVLTPIYDDANEHGWLGRFQWADIDIAIDSSGTVHQAVYYRELWSDTLIVYYRRLGERWKCVLYDDRAGIMILGRPAMLAWSPTQVAICAGRQIYQTSNGWESYDKVDISALIGSYEGEVTADASDGVFALLIHPWVPTPGPCHLCLLYPSGSGWSAIHTPAGLDSVLDKMIMRDIAVAYHDGWRFVLYSPNSQALYALSLTSKGWTFPVMIMTRQSDILTGVRMDLVPIGWRDIANMPFPGYLVATQGLWDTEGFRYYTKYWPEAFGFSQYFPFAMYRRSLNYGFECRSLRTDVQFTDPKLQLAYVGGRLVLLVGTSQPYIYFFQRNGDFEHDPQVTDVVEFQAISEKGFRMVCGAKYGYIWCPGKLWRFNNVVDWEPRPRKLRVRNTYQLDMNRVKRLTLVDGELKAGQLLIDNCDGMYDANKVGAYPSMVEVCTVVDEEGRPAAPPQRFFISSVSGITEPRLNTLTVNLTDGWHVLSKTTLYGQLRYNRHGNEYNALQLLDMILRHAGLELHVLSIGRAMTELYPVMEYQGLIPAAAVVRDLLQLTNHRLSFWGTTAYLQSSERAKEVKQWYRTLA